MASLHNIIMIVVIVICAIGYTGGSLTEQESHEVRTSLVLNQLVLQQQMEILKERCRSTGSNQQEEQMELLKESLKAMLQDQTEILKESCTATGSNQQEEQFELLKESCRQQGEQMELLKNSSRQQEEQNELLKNSSRQQEEQIELLKESLTAIDDNQKILQEELRLLKLASSSKQGKRHSNFCQIIRSHNLCTICITNSLEM